MRSLAANWNHLADAFDVGHNIAVREHDAFGRAGAAAGKNHGSEIVGLSGFYDSAASAKMGAEGKLSSSRRCFCIGVEVFSNLFEKNHARHFFQTGFGQEDSGREDRFDARTARRHEAIASLPAVKFKFTGTFPARRSAMFASAPPTDAGSNHSHHRLLPRSVFASSAIAAGCRSGSCRSSARCRWCRPCKRKTSVVSPFE